MSRRTERVGSTIKQELAQILMRDLNDPRLNPMTSITRVKVSPDLSIADVYVTVMGTPGQQTAALNALKQSSGLMRTKLTKHLTMRQAPFLKFHLDENLKKELEVLDLLDQVARENAELDRRRAAAGGGDSLTGQPEGDGTGPVPAEPGAPAAADAKGHLPNESSPEDQDPE
jgi:ribosome-binding factor A